MPTAEARATSKKFRLILPVFAAVFFCLFGYLGSSAVLSVIFSGPLSSASLDRKKPGSQEIPTVFVPVPPLTITMSRSDPRMQLRLETQIEVSAELAKQAVKQMPKIVDVMNTYLRATDLEELADPGKILRVRLQLLRRVDTILGGSGVKSLLITKFLIS